METPGIMDLCVWNGWKWSILGNIELKLWNWFKCVRLLLKKWRQSVNYAGRSDLGSKELMSLGTDRLLCIRPAVCPLMAGRVDYNVARCGNRWPLNPWINFPACLIFRVVWRARNVTGPGGIPGALWLANTAGMGEVTTAQRKGVVYRPWHQRICPFLYRTPD